MGKHRTLIRLTLSVAMAATFTTVVLMREANVSASVASNAVIYAAQNQDGAQYCWGAGNYQGATGGDGCAPGTVGFDCSGLVIYAFHQAGINFSLAPGDHYTDSEVNQAKNMGAKEVTSAQATPGTLVFFHSPSDVSPYWRHVGIYSGNGKMWNAYDFGYGVREEPVSDAAGTRLYLQFPSMVAKTLFSATTSVVVGSTRYIYAVGTNQHLYGFSGTGSGTSPWTDLSTDGGRYAGVPAVTYHNGQFDLFLTSPGGGMYRKTKPAGGTWSKYKALVTTTVKFAPGAGAVYDADDGTYHVFATSTAGHLEQSTSTSSTTFGAWQDLTSTRPGDGVTYSGIPAVTYSDGRFDVFATTPGGLMYQKVYPAGGPWASSHQISDVTPLAPGAGAVYNADNGTYHVFGVTKGGRLKQTYWNGSVWSSWQDLSTSDEGRYAGVASPNYSNGQYDVFVASPTGLIYQKTYDGTWEDEHRVSTSALP